MGIANINNPVTKALRFLTYLHAFFIAIDSSLEATLLEFMS